MLLNAFARHGVVALDHPVLGKRNHPFDELLFCDIVVVVE